jgi:acyl-coenzyme A thioesterase PaaI-like protein
MVLTEVSSDDFGAVFSGELNEHWTIGSKVHGGAMLALCANAARTFIGGQLEPIAVSGSFLWAPDPGPLQMVTTVRKRGRRVSIVDVELRQGIGPPCAR